MRKDTPKQPLNATITSGAIAKSRSRPNRGFVMIIVVIVGVIVFDSRAFGANETPTGIASYELWIID